MVLDSYSVSPSRCWRRRRPRETTVMKNIVAVVTTLGMACLLQSSLLPGSMIRTTHALSIPSSKLVTGVSPPTFLPSSDRRSLPGSRYKLSRNHPIVTNYQDTEFSLFMAPPTPQPRRPRRMLKKRTTRDGDSRRGKRNRRNRYAESSSSASSLRRAPPGIEVVGGDDLGKNLAASATATQELRPLIPSVRRDKGEDYWIDPKDLEKEQRRKLEQEKQRIALANRGEGEIMPKTKLMTEVKAPYRQNWIGYFSLMVAIISALVSQFPELLEAPTIRLPDL